MVFLTSVDILDTGFLTRAKTGSQLSTSDRANNGVVLKLKGVSIQFNSRSNLDDEANIGNFDEQEIPIISVEPLGFSLNLEIDTSVQDTSGEYGVNEAALIKELVALPRTKGLKALYYPVKTNSLQRNKPGQILSRLGTADTTEPQGDISISLWGTSEESGLDLTDVAYVGCRFSSCVIDQRPDTPILTIRLDGVVSK